jgi:hypothetical protein
MEADAIGLVGHHRIMARIGDYATAPDAAPAGWVTAGLRGFASSVLSVVPVGFQAYARIFHPAQRRDGVGWQPLSWREVAAANGRVAHRAMQWCGLVGCCSLSGGRLPATTRRLGRRAGRRAPAS